MRLPYTYVQQQGLIEHGRSFLPTMYLHIYIDDQSLCHSWLCLYKWMTCSSLFYRATTIWIAIISLFQISTQYFLTMCPLLHENCPRELEIMYINCVIETIRTHLRPGKVFRYARFKTFSWFSLLDLVVSCTLETLSH